MKRPSINRFLCGLDLQYLVYGMIIFLITMLPFFQAIHAFAQTAEQNIPPAASFIYKVNKDGEEVSTTPLVQDLVIFDPSSSADSDGEIVQYAWDWESDGIYDDIVAGGKVGHRFQTPGNHKVTLRITDDKGVTDTVKETVHVIVPPTADFSFSPAFATTQQEVAFTNQSSDQDGTVKECEWDFGDGETSKEWNAKHHYTNNGTYTITLRVKDNDGLKDEAEQTIIVENSPPKAIFSYAPSASKAGGKVEFDASQSADSDGIIESYAWDFGDNCSASGETAIHTYSTAGTYTVTLTVKDDKGATGSTKKVVSVQAKLEPPKARFSFTPTTPVVNDNVVFKDNSTDEDGKIVSWEWDFGDENKSTEQDPTHQYVDPGVYHVRLIVKDNDGLTDIATQEVNVNAPPKAKFSISPESPKAGQTVTFDASASFDPDGKITKYSWDFDSDGKEDATGVKASYAFTGGTFSIVLQVRDDKGAVDEHSQTIEVSTPEVAPHETWAMVVGIAKYPMVRQLNHSTNDAQAVYNCLVGSGGVPKTHVKLLLDDQATLGRLRGGLEWLSQQAGPNDLAIFCFSGHGFQGPDDNGDELDGKDEFLVPYDAQTGENGILFSTLLRDDEFGKFLDEIHSHHVLILFDSCFSGGASKGIKGLGSWGAKGPPEKIDRFNDFYPQGKIVLAASQENQESWEFDDLGHGVFTYFLLRGLQGEADKDKNFHITLQELADYVEQQVPPYVKHEAGAIQQPKWVGGGTKGLIVQTLNQPPQAIFSWEPDTVIEGDQVQFHDKSKDKDGKIVQWEWNFGDGAQSKDQNPIHKYLKSEQYKVCLTVTDDKGATDTKKLELNVKPNQSPICDFTWEPKRVKEGIELRFHDSSTDKDGRVVEWEWNFGDGTQSKEENPSHKYINPGKYTVTLIVTDNKQATTQKKHDLDVIPNQPPKVDFAWLPEKPFPNEEVLFEDHSEDPDGNIIAWSWDFGDGISAETRSPTHKYQQEGTYTVTLTVEDNGGVKESLSWKLSVAIPSCVLQCIEDNAYLVFLGPADRKQAKVGDSVLIYIRSILNHRVFEDRIATGVIKRLSGQENAVVQVRKIFIPVRPPSRGNYVKLEE